MSFDERQSNSTLTKTRGKFYLWKFSLDWYIILVSGILYKQGKYEVRELYITNKKESARITIRPTKISCGEVKVDVVSGLEYICSDLPPLFEIGSISIIQDEVWLDQFRMLVIRTGETRSSFWYYDSYGFDVILEPYELAWFE